MTLYSPRYAVNISLNLLFKMAVSRFAQVSDEEISEMSFSLFFNSEIILISSRGLFDIIKNWIIG